VLAAPAPFNLGYEIFREAQVMESLLQGLGGLLCLAAITCEALLRCAITGPAHMEKYPDCCG
jgi:hypothetical protein